MGWRDRGKYLIPVAFVAVSLAMMPRATGMGNTHKYNVAEVDLENYAYKDLTGLHSPYLINGGDSYSVEVPIDKVYEGFFYEDLEAGTLDPDFFKDFEGDFVGAEGWGSVLSPIFSFETRGINWDIEDTSGFKDFVGELMSFAVITDMSWDRDASLTATKEDEYSAETAEMLLQNAERVINGTLSWDYRSTDNREDFLAFRVGEYIYDKTIYSADLMYDAIHEVCRDKRVVITPQYSLEDVQVYLRYEQGAYVLEVPIVLSVQINGVERKYEMEYFSVFGFKTPSKRDVWNLWATSDKHYLNMITQDYIRNIREVGGE